MKGRALRLLLAVGVAVGGLPAVAMDTAHAAPGAITPAVAIHTSDAARANWNIWEWEYDVVAESLKSAFDSDGTPYVVITDADIEAAGNSTLLDGTVPRYPIVFSLANAEISGAGPANLIDYVDRGGFLFSGFRSFTNGGTAVWSAMGLADSGGVTDISKFTSLDTNHRLVSHVPAGELLWRMPRTDTDAFAINRPHFVRVVTSPGATVLAEWCRPGSGSPTTAPCSTVPGYETGPLLTTNSFGAGQFIYHASLNPILGHGSQDSSMYEYMIVRKAVEWAFESAGLPILKRSTWQYDYDGAMIVRHDHENYTFEQQNVAASAAVEAGLGAKGDYYLPTGVLRTGEGDLSLTDPQRLAAIDGLRVAVAQHGASIGSHNGGLEHPYNLVEAAGNPVPTFPEPPKRQDPEDKYYWHWGTDSAFELVPPLFVPIDWTGTGFADGAAYIEASLLQSFNDIESWMTTDSASVSGAVDNGRAGCGAAGDCPRIYVAANFGSTRDESKNALETLGAIITGEQNTGPFPHWTLSYDNPTDRYTHLALPLSDWYSQGQLAVSVAVGHYPSEADLEAAIDFYFGNGLLLNIVGHCSTGASACSEPGAVPSHQLKYVTYGMSKADPVNPGGMWSTNSVGIYDWWVDRDQFAVDGNNGPLNSTPLFVPSGSGGTLSANVSGGRAVDSDGDAIDDTFTAIEVVIPNWDSQNPLPLTVKTDGSATGVEYRTTDYGVKVRIGTASSVEISYGTPAPAPLVPVDVVSVTDAGGSTSADEVGVLLHDPASGASSVVLRDEVDGSLTLDVPISPAFEAIDLEVTPGGDVAVLLKRISDSKPRVRVISLPGGGVADYLLGGTDDLFDLEVLSSGDLAVLSRRTFDDMVRVRVIDPASPGTATPFLFGSAFTGDVLHETPTGVAVLGTRVFDGQVRVREVNTSTGAGSPFLLGKVFTGDDLAVSAAGHLGVVGTRPSDSLVRVRSINPTTGARSNYYWGSAFSGVDVEYAGGVDPAVLGNRASDQQSRFQARDATSRTPTAPNYLLDKVFVEVDVEQTLSGNYAILGQDPVTGAIRANINDTYNIPY